MEEFSYVAIEAATKSFSAEHLVGKGSHGSVFKATLDGGRIVAVKKPNGDASKLRSEIAILAAVKNPGTVDLLGFARSPTTELLVMEFLPNGSLHDLLHRSPTPPPWPWRADVALQLARAVLALHQASPAGIVHRDIKSDNVLLDAEWNAKLADFSLATRVAAAGDRPPAAAGTIGYLDPTCAESGKSTDVFSFGVLLLELVSSRKVVDMARDPALLVGWAVPRIRAGDLAAVCDGRMPIKEGMKRMLRVAARCVEEEVARRPQMAEVVVELQRVVEGGLRRKAGERVHLHGWVRFWRSWERRGWRSRRGLTGAEIMVSSTSDHGAILESIKGVNF